MRLTSFSFSFFSPPQNRFKLNKTILNFFVENINQKYRNNTYHNFQHGFSTAHFCFIAIFRCKKIEKCLRSIDVYAMLVAALMHDVDHPGNNNNYEVQRNSTLALRYNDISVLENHHGAVGWNVIYGGNGEGNGGGSDGNSSGGTIVDSLSKEDLLTFRKTTIKAILHTDMIHHFSLIEQLSSLNTNDAFDIKNPSDRITLVGTLVHAADISNPLIPNFEVVAKWVRTLYVVLVCVDRTDVFLLTCVLFVFFFSFTTG